MPSRHSILLIAVLSVPTILRAQSTAPSPVAPEDIDLGLKQVTATLPITHWQMLDGTSGQKTTPFPEVILSPDPATHRLLLLGPPIRVRAVIEVIQYLDRANTELLTKSRQLAHADPAATARLLNDTFSPTGESDRQAGGGLLAIPTSDGKSILISGWKNNLQKSFSLLDRLDTPSPPAASAPARALLQFQDTTVEDIFDFMEKNYPLIIVRTDIRLTTRITIKVADPVDKDQAIKLLNSILPSLAYTARAATENAPNTRTILLIGPAPSGMRRIPINVGTDLKKIEDSDRFITQVIPLQHFKGSDMKKLLESTLAPDADCTAGESNAIVITDTSRNIRRYVEKIQSLDK